MTVNRYEFSIAGCYGDSEFVCAARMDDEPDGDYVLYADYEAELARVKAESLRVVPVEIGVSRVVYDWYLTPTGLGYQGPTRECVETPEDYHAYADCQPVRLERWEDE